MALATICPHCNTTFRVASDQLKLRGGIVRCGACNEVFDGNAALVDPGAVASQQVLDAAIEPSDAVPAPAPVPESTPAPAPARAPSVAFQPPLLMRASASATPAPAPPAVPKPAVDAARSARRNAVGKRPAGAHADAPATAEAQLQPGQHEPEFVKIGRRNAQTGRRRLVLGAASAVLALALAVQGAVTFRNVLAARHPPAKAPLALVCAIVGCKIELPAQIDALSVETGELQSLDADTFSFTTLLRNQADLVQAWPHLELALTDADDKPQVRRVFTPAEYLPRGVAPATGIAPRSEQTVRLAFTLNQVTASGYHIALFYP